MLADVIVSSSEFRHYGTLRVKGFCLYVSLCFQAFNPDNEYHFKNRMKACQRNWAEVFGEEANMFAVSPSNTYQKVSVSRLSEAFLLLFLFESREMFLTVIISVYGQVGMKSYARIYVHTSLLAFVYRPRTRCRADKRAPLLQCCVIEPEGLRGTCVTDTQQLSGNVHVCGALPISSVIAD